MFCEYVDNPATTTLLEVATVNIIFTELTNGPDSSDPVTTTLLEVVTVNILFTEMYNGPNSSDAFSCI